MRFKVLLALNAVVCIAVASDLDTALWIAHCARNATVHGVPAAGVPSHSPVFVTKLVRNITLPLGQSIVHASIINPSLYGIPNVEIKVVQASKDDADVAEFLYELHWPKFVVNGQYEAEIEGEGVIHSSHKGNWELLFDNVLWSGQLHFHKEKHHINKLTIHWKNKHIKVHLTGAGSQGDTAAVLIQAGLETAFATGIANLAVEARFSHKLNDIWLKNATKVEALLDWCRHGQ